MKIIHSIFLLLLTGCTTFNTKSPPFVVIESGQPYATLSAPDSKDIEVWIAFVDDRPAARNILGEQVSSMHDVYVSPGVRDVFVTCHYFLRGRYNQSILTVELTSGKTYIFTCVSSLNDTIAEYRITDKDGSSIPFTARAVPKQ